jgi:predicted RNA binding protein YcfA (HicA-like mRNA interferase family)
LPRASRVLAALKRDGWIEVRRAGSHRTLAQDDVSQTFAWHDGRDLGNSELRIIARQFGYTLDELRQLM